MPKQSYQQIKDQIAKLQVQAEEVRKAEVKGVVERMKEAIAAYGLKPADLFGSQIRTAPAKAVRPRKTNRAKIKVKVGKYADGNGQVWSGKGRKPAWFIAAISQGKKPEEMLLAR